MKDNKTDSWEKNTQSTQYTLPKKCPTCQEPLKAFRVYVGAFPYIHADITLECAGGHRFNFCFPHNRNMTYGITIYDTNIQELPNHNRTCPFHGVSLEAIRFYGDLVFNDATRKWQLRCPICFYSERLTVNHEE